jgi:hypothetical protein
MLSMTSARFIVSELAPLLLLPREISTGRTITSTTTTTTTAIRSLLSPPIPRLRRTTTMMWRGGLVAGRGGLRMMRMVNCNW